MDNFTNLKKSLLYRQVFGYDLFISYSRKDGLDYAYKIAEHFISKGYECYIDQLSNITPGTELPKNIYEAIERCGAFVIIGSAGTQNSYPVAEEIRTFLNGRKNRPLIPISIDGAIHTASWYGKIEGLALINDSVESLNAKKPAEEVLTRIQNSLTFTKKSRKLRRSALFILLMVLCSGVFAIWQSSVAIKANKMANLALQNQHNAEELKLKAEAEKDAADKLKLFAMSAKDTADKLKLVAMSEKDKAEKVAASSYLIAEGNKLAESDISMAIMFYAYAYYIDSNETTFRIIDSFYKQNIPVVKSKNFDQKRYLNHFYAKTNFINANVCISENIFYKVAGGKLSIVEFSTGKQYNVPLKYAFSGYIAKPHSSKLIFYNRSNDPLIWSYDFRTKRTEQILNSRLVNKKENSFQAVFKDDILNYLIPADAEHKNSKDLHVSSSENNRYLLVSKKEEPRENFFDVLIIDLTLQKASVVKFKVPRSRAYTTEHFHVGETGINDKGSLLYVSTSPRDYRYLVYNLDSTFFIGSLYEGVVFAKERNNQPTVIKFGSFTDSINYNQNYNVGDDFILYGTNGGLITRVYMNYNIKELSEADNEDFVSLVTSPTKNIARVTAIEITRDFIITGTENGVIHFFENGIFWEVPGDDPFSKETYKNISTLQLGTVSKIVDLSFDEKRNILYANTADGDIFKLNVYQRSTLSKNSRILVSQLKASGINDLSMAEKERFGVQN